MTKHTDFGMSRSTDLHPVGSQMQTGCWRVGLGSGLCHSPGSLVQMSHPSHSRWKSVLPVLTWHLEQARGGGGPIAPFLVSSARCSCFSSLIFKVELMRLTASWGCSAQTAPRLPITGLKALSSWKLPLLHLSPL